MNAKPQSNYVSRGGDKLAHALDTLNVSPRSKVCTDLGSHVGGFVDCLLQRGASRVYSVDTSYGTLAWTLRKHADVVVIERTNAMHVDMPEPIELVTIDVGWTPQLKVLPNVARWLAPEAQVITLIKPHYEAPKELLKAGVLPEQAFAEVVSMVLANIIKAGWSVDGTTVSPILGHGGNRETLALLSMPSS